MGELKKEFVLIDISYRSLAIMKTVILGTDVPINLLAKKQGRQHGDVAGK